MLSKIYYAVGGFIIFLYVGSSLLGMIKSPEPQPRAYSLGKMRIERGKYVYVPPSTSSYPRSGSSSSSGSSYPRSGGYSGGK